MTSFLRLFVIAALAPLPLVAQGAEVCSTPLGQEKTEAEDVTSLLQVQRTLKSSLQRQTKKSEDKAAPTEEVACRDELAEASCVGAAAQGKCNKGVVARKCKKTCNLCQYEIIADKRCVNSIDMEHGTWSRNEAAVMKLGYKDESGSVADCATIVTSAEAIASGCSGKAFFGDEHLGGTGFDCYCCAYSATDDEVQDGPGWTLFKIKATEAAPEAPTAAATEAPALPLAPIESHTDVPREAAQPNVHNIIRAQAPPTEPAACIDDDAACVQWAADGLCTNPADATWLPNKCKLSCNLCQPGVEAPKALDRTSTSQEIMETIVAEQAQEKKAAAEEEMPNLRMPDVMPDVIDDLSPMPDVAEDIMPWELEHWHAGIPLEQYPWLLDLAKTARAEINPRKRSQTSALSHFDSANWNIYQAKRLGRMYNCQGPIKSAKWHIEHAWSDCADNCQALLEQAHESGDTRADPSPDALGWAASHEANAQDQADDNAAAPETQEGEDGTAEPAEWAAKPADADYAAKVQAAKDAASAAMTAAFALDAVSSGDAAAKAAAEQDLATKKQAAEDAAKAAAKAGPREALPGMGAITYSRRKWNFCLYHCFTDPSLSQVPGRVGFDPPFDPWLLHVDPSGQHIDNSGLPMWYTSQVKDMFSSQVGGQRMEPRGTAGYQNPYEVKAAADKAAAEKAALDKAAADKVAEEGTAAEKLAQEARNAKAAAAWMKAEAKREKDCKDFVCPDDLPWNTGRRCLHRLTQAVKPCDAATCCQALHVEADMVPDLGIVDRTITENYQEEVARDMVPDQKINWAKDGKQTVD